MYFVYAIRSLTRKYIYVGLTNNLERRLLQHQNGRVRTTRSYKPFELIFKQAHQARNEARLIEIKLKSGSGKEFLKNIK